MAGHMPRQIDSCRRWRDGACRNNVPPDGGADDRVLV